MNIKNLISLQLCIVFCTVNEVKSQQILVPIQKMIEESSYIFEGHYVSFTCFEDTGNHNIYTSEIYKVTKIFKGDLQCGFVELVLPGGKIGNRETYVTDMPSISDSGIVMADNLKEMPSYKHLKNNPVALRLNTMIEYEQDGQKTDYSYYWGPRFVNKQAVYDTLTKILGYEYMSCDHYPDPEPCPAGESNNRKFFVVDTIHIEQKKAPIFSQNISVYPNPAKDTIDIAVPDYVKNIVLYLYNNGGSLILQKDMTKETLHHFDINSLKPGSYSGTMQIGSRVYNFSFDKE
jgi:hypothetical protein